MKSRNGIGSQKTGVWSKPGLKIRGASPGFTLVEILVVLSIIAILLALIVPRYFGKITKAQRTAASADIKTLSMAIDAFRFDMGKYPTTEEGLEALTKQPSGTEKKWAGPYLKTDAVDFDLNDPWDNPYVYICPGKHNRDSYDLVSFGADGIEGGEGENEDIVNWRVEEK